MEQMKRSTRCARRRPELNNRHHSWSYQCSLSIIPGLCFCSATNRNELHLYHLSPLNVLRRAKKIIRVSVWFWRQWRRPSSIPCFCGGGEREMEKRRESFFLLPVEKNLKKRAGNRGGSRWCGGSEPANGKSITEESNTQIEKLHKGEKRLRYFFSFYHVQCVWSPD
jgi:hypothetical protein